MSFNLDIQIGNKGENIIYDYLWKHKSTLKIVDVSKDKWFQQFDIDFLQIDTEYNINKIEVKTDRLADKTGNMVYEYWSDRRTYSAGCFEKTQADYIFYYLINTKVLYIFKTQELQEWVHKHKDKLWQTCMGDFAIGYVIPLNDLKDIYIKENL